MNRAISRVINLIPDAAQQLWSGDLAGARRALLAADPAGVLEINGSFALVAQEGERVVLARSLERPLRYFLAKAADGPVLIVAERIDAIAAELERRGWSDQFHPSYTRMAPAHHVTTLRLIGCPDPNPSYRRFFDPPRATLPAELDVIGTKYIEALYSELRGWLAAQDRAAPIGVPFSGGIDSGAVLLCLHKLLLDHGQAPARLKAFTLSLDGAGDDAHQAREFLRRTNLEILGETIDVPSNALDPLRAVAVIEDYKPLDVECAAVNLALLQEIRSRYPEWRLLVDGDGGDENLKDYPIEANSELTIRSVVNNRMLYQEGWGVDSLKHSLTYTGGYSRGCVRGYACARRYGFRTFSPYTRPAVISVAEAIPFAELTRGSHERLYALKGDIVSRGVRAVLGCDMPVYPKRRFQHGSATAEAAARLFTEDEARYRRHFHALHS
ncbi:MAG TPA: asparagine synthase-related protein [Gemmatimonadales bacterium]|jgi:asparagine synthase (glutamine-hydrolysing)|nr:asparagine synthase-related protein [Gemmatimonadales bacterium]